MLSKLARLAEMAVIDYELPLLFQGPMVCGVLEDRKNQTRRTKGLEDVNSYPGRLTGDSDMGPLGYRGQETTDYYLKDKKDFKKNPGRYHWFLGNQGRTFNPIPVKCPYGEIGSKLWVRETWRVIGRDRAGQWEQSIEYRADHSSTSEFRDAEHWKLAKAWADARKTNGWGTPIHMPRWASRILLEITSIGCERVQDITVEDVFAEGVQIPFSKDGMLIVQVSGKIVPAQYVPKDFFKGWPNIEIEGERYNTFVKAHYAALWDSINGIGSWASNPWIWKICFKRII